MQHRHPWEELFLGHQAEPYLNPAHLGLPELEVGWGGGAGRKEKAWLGPEFETLGEQRALGQGCCLVLPPTLCLTWLWASRWGGPIWKAPRFWLTLSIWEGGRRWHRESCQRNASRGMGVEIGQGQGQWPRNSATEEALMVSLFGAPYPLAPWG